MELWKIMLDFVKNMDMIVKHVTINLFMAGSLA